MLLRAVVALLAVSFCSVSSQDQYCGVDVVFLLDASGSVGSYNFAKTLTFMDNVVDGLTIGPDDARIGLIRFSTYPYVQFYLNTYSDKQSVKDRVLLTRFTGGGTGTYRAIALATDSLFTAAQGMRSNAAQVAIILTDGWSSSASATAREAQRLRDKGVTVFSIGVGSGPSIPELNAMATDPDSAHVFQVSGFNALSQILNALQQGACKSDAANLCGGQADIVFLLDASSKVGSTNFAAMLQFVENVAQQFIVGPGDIQFGVDTFSSGFTHEFYLSQARNKAELQAYLSRVTYSGGPSTNTANALQRLRVESFTSSTGHRSNVPKIAVVITGDKSPDVGQTSAEAQMARNAGIILLTIGVGQSVDDAELKAIASDPDSQNVHRAAAFDALSGLEDAFAATTCAIVASPPPLNVVCGPQADIVFLIDTSGSVGPDNFNLILNFINTFVKELQIGQDKIRVGVAKFGSRPYNEFNLNKFDNEADLIDAINNIQYSPEGSDIAAGLRYTGQSMFSYAAGNRPGIPDVAVILTDGKSNNPDETKAAAADVRANGVVILAIGVGDDTSRAELNEIATDPDSSHVLTVKDFTKLNAIITAFQNQICREIPITLPPYVPPPTQAPSLVPDPCQDAISNCAAYQQSACSSFPSWASTFCAKTCGICTPRPPAVAPPCVDNLSNCSAYDVSVCSGSSASWASENCRKFCGYCSSGTQVGGFFNKCFYKGLEYAQGEMWDDGCSYECECVDAWTGQYVCYNKCPSYYNLPSQCLLVRQQGDCCLKPVCTFDGTYATSNVSGLCVYNGQSYTQGQIWPVGCQSHCFCVNATAGSYVCQSQCAKYSSLPDNCRLVKRPGECCEKPVCEFQTQIGVITGSGGTSGPGGNSSSPGVCLYQGQVYNQDDTWQDGCGKLCLCENATYGFIRCQELCPNFLNIPANCSLVTVFGQCCKSLHCDSPASFDSSQTTNGTIGDVPDPVSPPGDNQVPTLPPGVTYAPGLDPNTTPVPTSAPNPPAGPSVAPPTLTCGPAEEGKAATLTCQADLASCPNPFLIDWSADSRPLAKCTAGSCDGSFTTQAGIDVAMTASGSTVTLQSVSRSSTFLTTQWACEFCGSSQVVCNSFDTYVLPENPVCLVREINDQASGALKSVEITCSTNRVFPTAECAFERKTDNGQFEPISAVSSYSHLPTGESPVHYMSVCSVSVPAGDLGLGVHSFQAYVYPNVFNGKTRVSATAAAGTVEIALPEGPACSVSEVTDSASGAVVSVTVTCSSRNSSPAALCAFEKQTDNGQWEPITVQPVYSPASGGVSQCSVNIPVGDLGLGVHSFQAYIYPHVTNGLSLVGPTVALNTFNLELPASPVCTATEVIDPATGAVASVLVTLTSSNSVSPQAQCSFQSKKNNGVWEPITAQPVYSPTSGNASQCSVDVPVSELGLGVHSFQGYIYPHVTNGLGLVNVTVAAESVNLYCKPDAKRDVFFLVDYRTTIGPDNFTLALDFVQDMVSAFKIGDQNVLIGVITYGAVIGDKVWLKDYQEKAALLNVIEGLPYRGGHSVTNAALRLVRRYSFENFKGGRDDAPDYLILLTSGESTFPKATATEADLLAQTNITTVAVGVGDSAEMLTELNLIASAPALVRNVDTYLGLDGLWVDLVSEICKEVPQIL